MGGNSAAAYRLIMARTSVAEAPVPSAGAPGGSTLWKSPAFRPQAPGPCRWCLSADCGHRGERFERTPTRRWQPPRLPAAPADCDGQSGGVDGHRGDDAPRTRHGANRGRLRARSDVAVALPADEGRGNNHPGGDRRRAGLASSGVVIRDGRRPPPLLRERFEVLLAGYPDAE